MHIKTGEQSNISSTRLCKNIRHCLHVLCWI